MAEVNTYFRNQGRRQGNKVTQEWRKMDMGGCEGCAV